MTWRYVSSTGTMAHNGRRRGTGYSGYDDGDGIPEPGEGKNDPSRQGVKRVGPIPEGRYRIVGKPFGTKTLGPYCLRLEPQPGNAMFGRGGFLIHGDNGKGSASRGCIILARALREEIWSSGDPDVEVVAHEG